MIYRGMNQEEVVEAYDAFGSIPDCMGWLEANAYHSREVEAKLQPWKDLAYGPDPLQTLDIYAPSNAKNCPVLIDIHGGGWASGSKNSRAIPAETAIERGVIWVSLDYGLAPKYRIDQIVDHVGQAIHWVHTNIEQYGGDPMRLYIHGNSAGGHLAATTLMPGWAERYDVPMQAICGVTPVSGVYDMESQIHFGGWTQDALKLTVDSARAASPRYHLPKHQVPVILAYGENEPRGFGLEARDYAESLKSAGCTVQVIEEPGVHHFEIMNAFSNPNSILAAAVWEMMGV